MNLCSICPEPRIQILCAWQERSRFYDSLLAFPISAEIWGIVAVWQLRHKMRPDWKIYTNQIYSVRGFFTVGQFTVRKNVSFG